MKRDKLIDLYYLKLVPTKELKLHLCILNKKIESV